MVLQQHQAPAGLVQEEHLRHQLEFHLREHPASGEGARSTPAVEETAVEDSWGQDVEEEYIDIKEAVDADHLSYGDAGNGAAESTSESSNDEAEAEEEVDMAEEITADSAVDSTTTCGSSSATTSLDTHGTSVLCAAASGDGVGISAANSVTPGAASESARLRTSLETVLKGARDAICCAAIGTASVCGKAIAGGEQQQLQMKHVLLAALGSCDDACRVYVLPAGTQQQQQHASTGIGASNNCSTGSNSAISSRSRQKRTARQGMEAAATLREGHDTVSAATFSSDSKLLACGCFDGVVRVYRPRVTGALGTQKALPPPCDARRIADESTSPSPGRPDAVIMEPEAQETTSPQAEAAESAGATANATAPAARGGVPAKDQVEMSVDLVEELRGCQGDVVDVSFHPRGYALIVASADQTAWIWLLPLSLVNGSRLKEAAGGSRAAVLAVYAASAPLTCCCFSTSGREGIVGALDGTVSVFTAKTGSLLYTVMHPGLSVTLRQREQQQLETPCSVVTLRLSSTCITEPALVAGRASASGSACAAVVEPGSVSVPAAVGRSCISADNLRVSRTETSTNARERREDVLLGVGYEDGWVGLVRAATGDVIFAEQGHAQKAVESVAFVRVAAMAAGATDGRAGSGCCYLFASGGLDGRVVIWDVAHKCVRAVIAAPVSEAGPAVEGGALQQELLAAPGVTRLLVLQGSHLNVCDAHVGVQRSEANHGHQWLQQQQTWQVHAQEQRQLDAAMVCAGSTDGHLLVLDVRAGQVLLHWQAHAGAVMDLTALPPAGATSVKEPGAVAEPVVRAPAGVTELWAGHSPQQQGFNRCCCYWRVLSAGDDGFGKVWRIFLS